MNAYELADKLDWDAEHGEGDWQFQEAAAEMIRQLANEKTELERQNKILMQDVKDWAYDGYAYKLQDEYFVDLFKKND